MLKNYNTGKTCYINVYFQSGENITQTAKIIEVILRWPQSNITSILPNVFCCLGNYQPEVNYKDLKLN